MPPKKGRKRRPRDRRHAEPGETAVAAAEASADRGDEAARPAASDLPKLRVRMAGFVLAVITMFIGILNVAQGLAGSSAVVLITGIVLIVMAIVLGVLALAPGWVRGLLTRQ